MSTAQTFQDAAASSDDGTSGTGYESAGKYTDGEPDGEPDISLDSINKSRHIQFPIHSRYSPSWGPMQAFRELVQNWRDAIIKSFSLKEEEFTVIRREKLVEHGEQIIYMVPRLNSQPVEWLGYISWIGRGEHGTVELVNRRASLQPSHLDMGGTSKFGDRSQAGTHGEGLKIALLVLQRGQQNHCVRCHSGSFKWNFDFTVKGRLVVRLLRMSDRQLRQSLDESSSRLQSGSCPFAADPRRDVQFIIGQEVTGRNEIGFRTPRNPVRRSDFLSWCKAALFLDGTGRGAEIVSGKEGGLILGKSMSGSIYLKGLLLQETMAQRSASMTGKPLKFGYNFATGWTNRDRQSMSSVQDESNAILSIWDMALAKRPDLVVELSAMLNCTAEEYADVSGARRFIRRGTALRLAEYLFSTCPGQNWFFSRAEKAENPALQAIIDGLGLQGVELSDTYWKALDSFHLVRTADQEQRRRFENADIYSTRDSLFASLCDHILKACIRGCSYTRNVCIEFVDAGGLNLHTLYVDSGGDRRLLVHAKWLDPDKCRQRFGLPPNVDENDVLIHAIRQLFSDGIDQVPDSCFETDHDGPLLWLRKREKSRTDQRVLEYIRLYRDFETSVDSNQILIKHSLSPSTPVTIQLHRLSSCAALMEPLIASDVAALSNGCIDTEISSLDNMERPLARSACFQDHRGCFKNPADGHSYFAIISGSEPNSIVFTSSPIVAIKAAKSSTPVANTPNRISSINRQLDSPRYSQTSPVMLGSPDDIILPEGIPMEEIPEAGYKPQAPLEKLDILVPREWYSSSEEGVVIGKLRHGLSTRKRRRGVGAQTEG